MEAVLQGSEIFIILLVALVVLGPQRLPEMARKLGRWTNELREAAREIRTGLEAEVKEVRQVVDEFGKPMKEVRQAMRDTTQMAEKTTRGEDPPTPRQSTEERPVPTIEPRWDGALTDTEPAALPHRWVGPDPITGPGSAEAESDRETIERTGRPAADQPTGTEP